MYTLIVLGLAALSGFAVLIAPNIITVGVVSVIALVAIPVIGNGLTHNWQDTVLSIAVFLGVFQATFLRAAVLTKLGLSRDGRSTAKKIDGQPYA